MNREILFRGKHKDNGQWIYWNVFGRITTSNGKSSKFTVKRGGSVSCYYRIDQILEKIDHATIGQYTGLIANGKKIFEGDIVREVWGECVYPTRLVVFMDSKRRGWFPFACGDGCGCCEQEVWEEAHAEVIGNIHDNPGLLHYDDDLL